MSKLKIGLISLKSPPDSQDGAAKFFRGIYDYLSKQGHDVKLITAKWNYDLNDPNIIQLNIIRKRFLWVPHFNLGVIKYLQNNKFDIIHGNGPKGTLPIILSNKKRFVSTLHDLGPFETEFTKIPLERELIKIVAKKSTYITTCSNIIKRELKYFIPSLKLRNIFNLYSAIEHKFKSYPQEAKKLKDELEIDGPVIIYIGRIASYKGVNDIIKAYRIAKSKISDLNLVIGGSPDFSTEVQYKNWKKKYKDIHFIGFVPNDKIPYYYSMGDVFITYSYASEGFGLTPIEAIACGTPVICSSMPAFKEVLKDNAIFVPPKSPDLLAKEIVDLLRDDEKRHNLIKHAQKFIKRYSWEEVGKKLEQVYYRFLNQ
ncbi:MAG: glycosyltransferase [Candidatus Lokiarchaeota archaeon]|nr:glycosyltransferase [Candidatus Lokiarchaeota archaeon]MBD3202434.1 glycosyltransferase [Candidatus Lokiarchaeota archaeon]